MLFALDNIPYEEFIEYVENLSEWKTYESLYVSIGSKYNDPHQLFNYPTQIKNKKFATNAGEQMVPGFVRYSKKSRILVVVIDTFRTTFEWETNHRILETILFKSSHTHHFDIILWNHEINSRSLIPIIECFTKQMNIYSLQPNSCMICNYIRFSHPNESELALEEYIPKNIQIILDKNKQYSKCFYQWYGQTIYLYHLLYCYKEYDFWKMVHYQSLHRIFEQIARERPIDYSLVQLMQIQDYDDPKMLAMLSLFARCSVDIRSRYAKEDELAPTLCIT